MLPLNSLSVSSCWSSWFILKKPTVVAFVQDVVHVGVKLKVGLLKPSIELLLGKFLASGRHLHLVLTTFGNDQHGLKIRDIDHKDKQNFDAVVHITSQSVLSLLSKIHDAKGTATFLEVLKCRYLDKKIGPIVQD